MGVILVVLAALAPVVLAQGFPMAESADVLRRADGEIFDTSFMDEPPHWTFSGEWLLNCLGAPCSTAALENVIFDMSLIMVRPDGTQSHNHAFSDFQATAVTVTDDTLTVEGTVVGTGGVGGLTDIVLVLRDVSTLGEFTVTLVDNDHVIGEVGGVIKTSR